MVRHKRLILVGLSTVALILPRPAWSQLTDADRKGIQAVTDRWLDAMRKNDSTAVAATYTEDAMLLPPNAPVVKGRTEIRHFVGQFPKITSFNIKLTEMEGDGNLAYTRGTYDVSLMAPGAKTPDKDSGKFLEIRRKESDGSWLVLRDIWNSDHPPGH
jgi:uncharacterized protein (TIGR02246 family)